MVGGVGLIVIFFDLLILYRFYRLPINTDNFVVWLIITYFLGHLIQGIANIMNKIPILNFLIQENKDKFKPDEEEVLNEAKKYFGLTKQNYNKLWNFCYIFANAKDVTGQVQSFNAYYSMYRGWLVIFVLESLFLLYMTVLKMPHAFPLLLLNLFFVLVFYQRSKRFWHYLRDKVFQTFIVVKTLKL